jgi:hypothetical protein
VSQKSDHLGGVDVGAARRSIVLSTMALAFAATMALGASATHAHATTREISTSSYRLADSLLPNTGLERMQPLSPFGGVEAHGCSVHCGPALGTNVVRRSEMLTSNTADVATRKTTDSAGHALGVGGTVVVERLEPDASGSLINWVVVSEHTVDENGSHSWSLLSGEPSNMPWLPNDLYRFEASSFSTDLLAETTTTPEASTWVMVLTGFAGLGMAGYRNSKNPWRAIQFPVSVLTTISRYPRPASGFLRFMACLAGRKPMRSPSTVDPGSRGISRGMVNGVLP